MAFRYCSGLSGPRSDNGWAKAQPAMVLILKHLRRWGHGLKSHPIDWEKRGIEPRAPWFTRERLPVTQFSYSWPWSLAITSTGRVSLWIFRSIPCSTGSGSGLKGLRRRDHGFKSHLTDWEVRNRTCHPWFTRHRLKNVLWLSLGSNK